MLAALLAEASHMSWPDALFGIVSILAGVAMLYILFRD